MITLGGTFKAYEIMRSKEDRAFSACTVRLKMLWQRQEAGEQARKLIGHEMALYQELPAGGQVGIACGIYDLPRGRSFRRCLPLPGFRAGSAQDISPILS
jgi:hypothetical protein